MNKPFELRYREKKLLSIYTQCQLSITPQGFYSKWGVTYEQIAEICDRSVSTVRRWFQTGKNYRSPNSNDLRHLAIVDFLWEHFEEIPEQLWERLCRNVEMNLN